jgi:hypothetical protein
MNETFKEILKDIDIESEDAILVISDKIFITETIQAIKEKATEEAFDVFIGAQTIGCWKSDGLAIGIFGNFPVIVPYIPSVMENLNLFEVSEKIKNVIKVFPLGTDFTQNNQDYCDTINFLEGHERFIKNKEKFGKYPASEAMKMRNDYRNSTEAADNYLEKLWGYGSPNNEGWGYLTDYLKKNLNARLWK